MAKHEPQLVYRRDQLVAAVVSPDLAGKAVSLVRPSLAMKLAELQRLCTEENYELSASPRGDRRNPFTSRGGGSPPARRSPKR